MKAIYIFLIFVVVVLAQLFVPTKMIYDQEEIIVKGTAYKFKTQPVDPSDPFKGKYIRLNYEVSSAPTNDTTWIPSAPIYVTLTTDESGFAKVQTISKAVPKEADYLKLKSNWYNAYEKRVEFTLPFNEFYMNENKAYDAEVAHANAQRDSLPNTTYALVYILKGRAVLENVFINEVPIGDYVDRR